ncbi:uncharacterized protein K460DRAFT_403222 [Cucurbitaria berberidis CBS 394.84]|uniref:Uncharacterized protein n=1 Tax=Cucurbitaria berberidis CBS 394.84 TaxID=1168544 RepID=A0A9P4GLL2_9PLEO|nr:uncharacterized protein K460DRAFT_403222 [Cucurbitaria berberidis CBS 394.84]KAF1847907.1 hypothetical protein K460DRAFT_403222 [Cucurbitaria berberidis CBS 394.84]
MDFETGMLISRCQQKYGYLEMDMPSSKTVFCTFAIIWGAILLEVFSNARLTCCGFETHKKDDEEAVPSATDSRVELSAMTVLEQPKPRSEPHVEPQPTPNSDDQTIMDAPPVEGKPTTFPFCCYDNPSPSIRANRLASSTLLFGLILTAFIIRIREATVPPAISARCLRLLNIPAPHWHVITILNIIPFVCASFAFLRTLVDGVLVRWGKGLTYKLNNGRYLWTPCMPFMLVFIVLYAVVECIKIPIAFLMGHREVSLWTANSVDKGKGRAVDIEMQDEEAQRLVGNMDGPVDVDDEDLDGPPAYHEVYSPRVSTERKHALDK